MHGADAPRGQCNRTPRLAAAAARPSSRARASVISPPFSQPQILRAAVGEPKAPIRMRSPPSLERFQIPRRKEPSRWGSETASMT